jgi:HPr kinase/phosphorylase
MKTKEPEMDGVSPQQALAGLSGLDWVCTTTKVIQAQHHAIKLFGFLNPLRSTSISLVTENELEWIYSQPEELLQAAPSFDPAAVTAIVLCKNCNPNPAITSVCRKNNIALVKTGLECNEALDYLQSCLPKVVAARGMQHGVFLAVMNVGVLITGASGVGKSEVAMDLVQRGHQLIADDAVEIHRGEQSELFGECPEPLKGYIEIRGLGIINVLKMFGPSSVLDSYKLQLIIDLIDATNSEIRKVDRLAPSLRDWEMLGINVPCLTMLVAPGRNLSVLIEAAVRDHLLRMAGIDSSAEFINAHNQSMTRMNQQHE